MRFKPVKFATIIISIARYVPSKLVSVSIQTANQRNPPASSCSEYTADLADLFVVKKPSLRLLDLRRLGSGVSGLFRNGASSWLITLFAFSRMAISIYALTMPKLLISSASLISICFFGVMALDLKVSFPIVLVSSKSSLIESASFSFLFLMRSFASYAGSTSGVSYFSTF